MGGYCKYCNRRCFVHLSPNLQKMKDKELAEKISKAYGTSNIIATCNKGQEFELNKIGYNYDAIVSLQSEVDDE